MAVIPVHIFRTVEDRLHAVCRALREEPLPEEDVESLALGCCEGYAMTAGSKGYASDRTARVAMMLGVEMHHCEEWLPVILEVERVFMRESEGMLFRRYYGRGMTVTRLAQEAHYDRQTINRYREKIVSHCALLAAEKGLIKWGGKG